MASRKLNKSIKQHPELFSDEKKTASEKILDELEAAKTSTSISDFTEIPEVLEEHLEEISPEEKLTVQQQIDELLDKYYNGDRNVDKSKRYAHREEYKRKLIKTLQQYGIKYIEKHHYPLSMDEKHVIRMDFYGTINRPHPDRLSRLYKNYCRPYPAAVNIEKTNKKTKQAEDETSPINNNITYPFKSYDLSTSPVWNNLFRLFPRFQKLENTMLKTIQSMHISPDDLKKLTVYDFSDILFRTYRKNEDDLDAHLFLGARQAFVKDVFKKHEAWIRDYLKRKNIHPRYIDELIKAAQSKGITGNITISSDINTYMCQFAAEKSAEFQKFIMESIRSDNYAEEIQTQIRNDAYTIQGPTLNFLQTNQVSFEKFIKQNLMEDNYINIILGQFDRKAPSYVLKDIKDYLQSKKDLFHDFLKDYPNSQTLENYIFKKLPEKINPRYLNIINQFINTHSNDFFITMLDNSRSSSYANFALNALSETPVLNDYAKDMLTSFILNDEKNFAKKVSPTLLEEIKETGLSDNMLEDIIPYIKTNKNNIKTFFKKNNAFTFDELQNELMESTSLAIQTSGITEESDKINKHFILSNTELFKAWYARFHTEKYKKEAITSYNQIAQNGILGTNEDLCITFLKERLNNFIEFSAQHHISANQIVMALKQKKINNNHELSAAAHNFIVAYGTTFQNFLLQQRLQKKEVEVERTLQSIKSPHMTSKDRSLIHKFILDNQSLYMQCLGQNKPLNNQTQQIYSRLIHNKSTGEDKELLKAYLSNNIYNYLLFQQDDAQLQPHVKMIADNVKKRQIDPTANHWLKAFTQEHAEEFSEFLNERNIFPKDQENELLANINFNGNKIICQFNDGYSFDIRLTVHHKHAIKDTGDKKMSMENIAAINNFENLCIFTDFWHKIMHSMDCMEPVEDKERYVSRLMLEDSNTIFYGGETPEDQLQYDYTNDPRSLRNENRLKMLVAERYGYQND